MRKQIRGDSVQGDILDPPPLDPFDAAEFMFTTETVSGARAVLEGLGACGDVWEYRGRYYPARRGSADEAWLRGRGAEVLSGGDDALHQEMDRLVSALQQSKAP